MPFYVYSLKKYPSSESTNSWKKKKHFTRKNTLLVFRFPQFFRDFNACTKFMSRKLCGYDYTRRKTVCHSTMENFLQLTRDLLVWFCFCNRLWRFFETRRSNENVKADFPVVYQRLHWFSRLTQSSFAKLFLKTIWPPINDRWSYITRIIHTLGIF